MKVLVTGGNGQLASELKTILNEGKSEIGEIATKNIQATFVDVEDLDITNNKAVKKYIGSLKPDVVINCAAYTNVDGCETDTDAAFKVNTLGPRNLAIACEEVDAALLHVSTDYVFSGTGSVPRSEFDQTAPTSAYGTTKLMGEQYVREFCSKYFIVRTAWLYGYNGKNFVYTMIKLAKSHDSINVVNDQKGNPTNANDLAHHLLKLIRTEEYGIYHCTGEGECTWYDFAKKIIELSGVKCEVKPCTSDEFPSPTKRPEYSSLDNRMLRCTIGNEMRDWEPAIEHFMKNIDIKGV